MSRAAFFLADMLASTHRVVGSFIFVLDACWFFYRRIWLRLAAKVWRSSSSRSPAGCGRSVRGRTLGAPVCESPLSVSVSVSLSLCLSVSVSLLSLIPSLSPLSRSRPLLCLHAALTPPTTLARPEPHHLTPRHPRLPLHTPALLHPPEMLWSRLVARFDIEY